jgi:hypothetical protein
MCCVAKPIRCDTKPMRWSTNVDALRRKTGAFEAESQARDSLWFIF